MGDKTQLATISLAVEYQEILTVWMGTTLGMMVSNGFGIVVGTVMGKRIPEQAVKWFAALLFIAFGYTVSTRRCRTMSGALLW